jgi:hypothetical protein
VISKVGSTYYASPSGSYTAYSGSVFKTVIESAMGQLTSGGVVYIKAGLYDNLDPIFVPVDKITIQGAGKNITKLKLKASADVGGTSLCLITVIGVNYTTIEGIELDGNGANQTRIDNGIGTTAKCIGIGQSTGASASSYLTVKDCYIHNFSQFGIYTYLINDVNISNNRFEDNYWNNISILGDRGMVDHNYCHGGADVSITSYGTDNVISNNFINGMDGTHGSVNSHIGIDFEGGTTVRNKVVGNTVTGTLHGIMMGETSSFCEVTGNSIYALSTGWGFAISVLSASNALVNNNKIHDNTESDGIFLGSNSIYTSILNNDVYQSGKSIDVNASTYNSIIGNTLTNGTTGAALYIESGGNYNYVMSNIFNGVNADNDFTDLGTGNVYKNNYLVKKGVWLSETGTLNNTATATSDGLTTGILTQGSKNITVTSASANNIVALPAASAATIGTKITGVVAANGFKLQVQAAQATTVYLNNVTTNVKAAIPANTYFEVTCVDATHWILRAWTMLGAPITAIIPV